MYCLETLQFSIILLFRDYKKKLNFVIIDLIIILIIFLNNDLIYFNKLN